MQRQGFFFNPTQGASSRPVQSPRQHETVNTDFGPIGGASRFTKFSSRGKEPEPLLLSQEAKSRQQEDQVHKEPKTAERLTTLHSQLYQQTEKLRQWKINTELQISEKDRKITEASKTIDSLRKSILELQLLNESVSSKLQNEKALQEETCQKISTTRNMCNALKEHLVRLENGVLTGERMLDVQKSDAKQKATDFQELALRFEELQIKVTGKEFEMEQAMMRNQNEYKEELERLGMKLSSAEKTNEELVKQNANNEAVMIHKDAQIEQAKEEIDGIKGECLLYKNQVEKINCTLKEIEALLEDEKRGRERISQDHLQLEEYSKAEIRKLQNLCEEKKNEINLYTDRLHAKEKQLEELDLTVDNLKEMIVTKNCEIEELLAKFEEASKENSKIKLEVNCLHEKMQRLQQTLNDVESSLHSSKDEEERTRALLENEKSRNEDLKEEVEALQKEAIRAKEMEGKVEVMKEKVEELEVNKEELQFQANFAMSQVEETTLQLQTITNKNQALEGEITKAMEELCQSKILHEKALKDLQDKEMHIKEVMSEFNKSKENADQLQAKYEQVCLEKCNNEESLQELMMSRDKSSSQAEIKVKNLQERVAGKIKQISKLQSEMKSLKSQLKAQEKLTKKLETDLTAADENNKALERSKEEISDLIKQKEKSAHENHEELRLKLSERDKEKDCLENEKEELKRAAEMASEKCSNAQMELAASKQRFEAEISEMCRTLESYKMENEKLMNVKEKELDQKTQDILESKGKLEAVIRDKEQELKVFQQQIAEKEARIKELIQANSSTKEVPREEKQSMDIEMAVVDTEHLSEGSTSKTSLEDAKMELSHGRNTESPHVRKLFPKSPLATTSITPKGSFQTPQGILRYGDDRSGKSKRVAFSFNDSTSSDEEDPLHKRQRTPTSAVSKLPSKIISVKPTVRDSPKLAMPLTPKGTKIEKSSIRRQSDTNSLCSGKAKKVDNTDEIEKFNKLFPKQGGAKERGGKSEEGSKRKVFKSKIKKVVPRTKKSQTEKMDLSWFDADSAFGFGAEE